MRIKSILLFFSILLSVPVFNCTQNAAAFDKATPFTAKEQTWIRAHPNIRLVINTGPPPVIIWEGSQNLHPGGHPPPPDNGPDAYGPPPGDESGTSFQNGFRPPPMGSSRPLVKIKKQEADQFKGVALEYLKEIEKITGLHFIPVLLSHHNLRASFEAVKNGQADMIPMMLTGERARQGVLMTDPYIQLPVVVVMAKDSRGYTNLEQLSTLKVAGVLSIQNKLNQIGLKIHLIHTSPIQGLIGVSTGKYDAFIGELPGISFELKKNPVTGIKIAGELPLPSNVAMGVSAKIKEFVPIFNKALAIVSSHRKQAIREKWFKITYEKKVTFGRWVWLAMVIGGIVLISGFLGFLYYKRRLRQIQSVVDELDPHLLSAVIDRNIIITQVTQALCDVTGFDTRDLVGKPLLALGSPAEGRPDAIDDLWQTIKKGKSWKGEVKIQKKDGSTLWTKAILSPLRREHDRHEGGYTIIYQDVSQQKHYENLAIKDELTGLYNRRHFNALAPELLKQAGQENRHLALILMDVDNFKKYNDTYGHPEGDNVLSSIGHTLNSIFKRRSDFAFRLGGEEFGVLTLVSSPEKAESETEKTRQAIQDLAITHELNPPGVVTISMGLITLVPQGDDNMDTLYKKADKALYNAKEGGRNQYVCASR